MGVLKSNRLASTGFKLVSWQVVVLLYFQGQRATPLNRPMALAMPVDKRDHL